MEETSLKGLKPTFLRALGGTTKVVPVVPFLNGPLATRLKQLAEKGFN
jgi:hypothetical protein